MPSPFPGMDPWLEDEAVFPDLHHSLVVLLSEVLNASMPSRFVACIRRQVWDDDPVSVPVVVGTRSGYQLPGMLAVSREMTADPWEEPYLEIVSTDGHRLVTAVEVLSRSNKAAGEKGRKTYETKQEEYDVAGVSLVEIDLLRGGPHVTVVSRRQLVKAAGPFDYHVGARLGWSGDHFAAPILLKDRLPTISVPLDPDVPPVPVDLQPLLDRAYDTGRYAARVRYDRPCAPPLTDEQREWAEAILRAKGLLKTTA